MHILVTGASGFLASHIILRLLQDGHTVRGSVRNTAKGAGIRAALAAQGADVSALEIVALDLTSDTGWDAAMVGISTLIHTASPFVTTIPDDEADLIRPAVDGTRRALNAALGAGVKRIVLTSSEAAVTRGHAKGNHGPFGEADWTDITGADVTPYFKSKTLAEREAWKIMRDAGRENDLSVINPGFILGPMLDQDSGTSGALVARMMGGKLPGAPDVYLACVHVDDVVAVHVAAIADPRGFGRRILVSNDCISFGDVADILAQAFPQYARALPTRRLPSFVVRLVALGMKDARGSLPLLGRRFAVDHGLAREILGRDLVATDEAVRAMGRSLIAHGVV